MCHHQEGDDPYPRDEKGEIIFGDSHYIDTWKEMETLVKEGLVKSIGVSNFNEQQIKDILKICKIKPAVNQVSFLFFSLPKNCGSMQNIRILKVECHPYLNQKKLKKFCEAEDILMMAYSPLGSPGQQAANKYKPIEDTNVLRLSLKHGKSPSQILIRYQVSKRQFSSKFLHKYIILKKSFVQIQRGVIVLPKSVNKHRIIENANVFDFRLEDADMDTLDSLNLNIRFNPFLVYDFEFFFFCLMIMLTKVLGVQDALSSRS